MKLPDLNRLTDTQTAYLTAMVVVVMVLAATACLCRYRYQWREWDGHNAVYWVDTWMAQTDGQQACFSPYRPPRKQ